MNLLLLQLKHVFHNFLFHLRSFLIKLLITFQGILWGSQYLISSSIVELVEDKKPDPGWAQELQNEKEKYLVAQTNTCTARKSLCSHFLPRKWEKLKKSQSVGRQTKAADRVTRGKMRPYLWSQYPAHLCSWVFPVNLNSPFGSPYPKIHSLIL